MKIPTLLEVSNYFILKGMESEAENFYDYYESNGWKVGGRAPMKKWEAAANRWIRTSNKYTNNNGNIFSKDSIRDRLSKF